MQKAALYAAGALMILAAVLPFSPLGPWCPWSPRSRAQDAAVEKVCSWTPDKDLVQCVSGARVVQVDRKSGQIRDGIRCSANDAENQAFLASFDAGLAFGAAHGTSASRNQCPRRPRATSPMNSESAGELGPPRWPGSQ